MEPSLVLLKEFSDSISPWGIVQIAVVSNQDCDQEIRKTLATCFLLTEGDLRIQFFQPHSFIRSLPAQKITVLGS